MSEKSVEQIAAEHAEWFVGIVSPIMKSVAQTFFIHGHKHGREEMQREVLNRITKGALDVKLLDIKRKKK